jgi:hypothetical protein
MSKYKCREPKENCDGDCILDVVDSEMEQAPEYCPYDPDSKVEWKKTDRVKA